MLEKMNRCDFEAVFAIMEASFPPDERRPIEEQRAFLNEEGFEILVARDGDAIKGFLSVWHFEKFGYIEHFAVDSAHRNGGLGSRMLQETVTLLGGRACLEVEPPQNELTRRRVGFYGRNGFVLNEYPYVQPPISKGKEPVPLLIMSHGRALTAAEFEHCKDVLYRRVYKCR